MNTTHQPSNDVSTQKKDLSIYLSLNNPLPTKMYKYVVFRATLNSPKDVRGGSRRQASGEVLGGGEASREVSSGWDCLKAHYGVLVDL